MKIFLCILSGILFYRGSLLGQHSRPITWKVVVKKVEPQVFEIVYHAFIEKGWHIFSQFTPQKGEIPTKFSIRESPFVKVLPVVREVGALNKVYVSRIGGFMWQYFNDVYFIQKVKLVRARKVKLYCKVEYTLCNESNCLPSSLEAFVLRLR